MKRRRKPCQKHTAPGRSWDEYVLSHYDHDDKGNKIKEVWRCRECKEEDDKWLAEYDEQKALERINYEDWKYSFWKEIFDREEALKKRQKDELWDCYVKKTMFIGVKGSGLMKIPKELLQLKRATIRLNRLIDKAKEAQKEAIENQKKEAEKEAYRQRKLKGVLVQCKKHGALFLKDVIKGGKSRWTGEQRYKCRACMKDTHRNYYERRKDYVLAKHAEYRKENPEKVKETKAKSWRKCNGKNKEHDPIEGKSTTSN